MSPHHAAKIDSVSIDKHSFHLPVANNQLIVETAGGIMSPLADDFLNIDLMMQINLPVVLVSNDYLGSINHALLTIEALKNRKMNLLGIIFNGEEVASSRSFILKQSKLPHLFSVPRFEKINHEVIRNFVDNTSINVL
jgi:dethiobiotin synthetase